MATYTVGYGPRYVRRLEGRCLRPSKHVLWRLEAAGAPPLPVRLEGGHERRPRMPAGSGSREFTAALLFVALQFVILALAAALPAGEAALRGPLG